MVCCLLFFDDAPLPDDPRAARSNTFQISMMDGLVKNQPVCCLTYFCAPCSAYYTRYRVLNGDLSRYICCQGYMDICCFKAGSYGEASCPEFCLCLESCICLGPSMSSSRMFVMDVYGLQSDGCDNRLVRFNNCLQLFSCICHIMAIFDDNFRDCANLLDVIARTVFYCLMGCMAAQVNYEVDYRRAQMSTSGHPTVTSPMTQAYPLPEKKGGNF